MDPFHPSELRPSKPLPLSATAQLTAGGDTITLQPLQSDAGAVVGFAFPAGLLPLYGAAYDVLVTPWQDLAGNPGAPPSQLMTRALVLVAQEDFEDHSAAMGDAFIVDDSSSSLPPINGHRSAMLASGRTDVEEAPHISARLQVSPGDTVVRFAARPFGQPNQPYTNGISMQAGVPGGAITSATLPEQETLAPSTDPLLGTPGLGDVRTIEIPLPAGATSEVVVDLSVSRPFSCGLPHPASVGYLIDDLRLE